MLPMRGRAPPLAGEPAYLPFAARTIGNRFGYEAANRSPHQSPTPPLARRQRPNSASRYILSDSTSRLPQDAMTTPQRPQSATTRKEQERSKKSPTSIRAAEVVVPNAPQLEPHSPPGPSRPMSAPTGRRHERAPAVVLMSPAPQATEVVEHTRNVRANPLDVPEDNDDDDNESPNIPVVAELNDSNSNSISTHEVVVRAFSDNKLGEQTSPPLSGVTTPGNEMIDTPRSLSNGPKSQSSKNFLNKMRGLGSAAVALARLQRIDHELSIDVLRERGFDVVNLDKMLDRLPRFVDLVRGKMMRRHLKLQRIREGNNSANSVTEQLRKLLSLNVTSSIEVLFDLSRSTSVALYLNGESLIPTPLPVGSSAAISDSYVKLIVGDGEEGLFVLHFQHIQSWEMSPSTSMLITFYPTAYSEVAPLQLEVTDTALMSSIVQHMSKQHHIGMQLVKRITAQKLDIVHFNDVYHLETFKYPNSPGVVGGASRFLSKLREIQLQRNPLILFSGDFMSPSLQSVLMRGKHIIDAFNLIGVHFGTFGNHEFDYGMEALQDCIQGQISGNFVFAGSNTQWVMSNMVDGDGKPLCGSLQYALTTWNGVRVGILGLSENWLPSCNQLAPHEAHYLDVFSEGERLARMLKEQGAACVIALTHSRLQTDKEMSQRCPTIDLILGGQHHFYKCDPKHRLIKSGEEFEFLSEIEVLIGEHGDVQTRSTAHPITRNIVPDLAMEKIIDRYETRVQQRMGKVIGITMTPLDCTEACCRFKEGLLPGFFCDVMAERSKADFAVLGGAAIAGKAIMPAGDITLGDVFNWFPGDTKIMTIRIPGSTVKKLLDVMVREVPAEAPSFPHPSRQLQFTINTMGTPTIVQDIFVKGAPLVSDAWYTVAVEDFVGLGKAKYKFIPKEGEQLVDEECAEQITYWIIEHFEAKKKRRSTSVSPSGSGLRALPPPVTNTRKSTVALMGTPGSAPLTSQPSRSDVTRGLTSIANAAVARSKMKRKSEAEHHNDRSGGMLQSVRLDASGPTLRSDQLLGIMEEVALFGGEASETLDSLSAALAAACARLVPCDVARCFHHHTATGTSCCVTQPCDAVRPTRVAAHPRLGTYHRVRETRLIYKTRGDVRADRFFHRASEGHPRGAVVQQLVTVPVLNDGGFATCVQLVNPAEPISAEHELVLTTFASQVSVLIYLAHQREVKENAEALQKKVLEAAVELLGNEDINQVKLFDQLANVSRLTRKIFDARIADVHMIDYGTKEAWTVTRTKTSKKSHEDVIVRKQLEDDFLIYQAVDSGLPTLQDPTALDFLQEDVDVSATMNVMSSHATERTPVLVIPIFAPGAEDVLCVLRMENRRGNTFFTSYDEEAAISFSAFAAVAIQTSSEVEALRTGVNRSQLKIFPTHELNRIRWKRGWGSVRSKLRTIISLEFQAMLGGLVDSGDAFQEDPVVTEASIEF
ncbi:5-nucleotidase domain-containing protein, putative [Bodo saltans]|uniref:5-nucleotidase domain-containing protein, putative n=1 Tax=Bodo saltans TaxID=75058 RepID=A0A0S4JH97_BODSA|nr:5-nucleotidase domain-containing protein, putative [Bodo saltans]|eukprot:CUG88620.1 5-nucleotidase domain-containing protein, putative [Bodo saltans]